MIIENKKASAVIIAIMALVLTHGTAYYYGYKKPPQVEIKQVETVKKDVVTVVKEVERPDGTKEKVTTIVDKSKESSKTSTSIKKQELQYLVGISYNISTQAYKIDASRRIFGPVFGTVEASSNGNLFIGGKYEF
jgi:hypothetical protein